MQTIPNPVELTHHVRLKPEGVQAGYARRRKRQDHVASDMLESGSIQGSEATAKHRSHAPVACGHLEAAVQCPALSATVEDHAKAAVLLDNATSPVAI